LEIITLMPERGARVDYHDPYVPEVERAHGFPYEMRSVPLEPQRVERYDAVLILTDHGGIDYGEVVARAQREDPQGLTRVGRSSLAAGGRAPRLRCLLG
jgi:UDP-N-acetyl-D-mannosaminuronate dehydrogenase